MSGFALVKRVLGVDYGQARIGLAISDELGMLAHPLETVSAKLIDAAAKRIAQLARERDVAAVVVGLPRHMSGASGAATDEVNAFVAKLRPLLGCAVIMWDERLTTTAAHRALRDAGKKTRSTRGVVDQVAAQMILQGYLDSRQGPGSGPLGSPGLSPE
jgi:putative holliday junction resolvase